MNFDLSSEFIIINMEYIIHKDDFQKSDIPVQIYGDNVPLISLMIRGNDDDSEYSIVGRMLYNPFELLIISTVIVICEIGNISLNSVDIVKLMIYSKKYKSDKNYIDIYNNKGYCYLFKGLSKCKSKAIIKLS